MTLFHEYHDSGHSETLVLLHSGGMTGAEWQPQIAPLSKYFNVLVPDALGHGQSVLHDNQVVSISSMAHAVIDVLEERNIEKAHILGSSMGGAIALWIALNAPHVVDRLIVYRIGYTKNQSTYEQTANMANPEYWRQYGLHSWLSKIHKPQGGDDAWEQVIARVSAVLDPQTSDHNHSLSDLERIRAKTLLIAGDRDPLIPLPTVMEMHRAIPDSALWIMPNATHITASNTWRASAFAEEIIRFLR